MKIKRGKWKILGKIGDSKKKTSGEIINLLLKNRGIKTKKERDGFFNPPHPDSLTLSSLSLKKSILEKAILRIEKAKKKKERVIVYGDYDADGITASAILWECLYVLGVNALPYIPERFSEGYGLNGESIEKIKKKYPDLGLIISVDNGIVAHDAVDTANKLGIDVIITDHHERGEKYPKAYSVIHTTKISGSALAWIFAREIRKRMSGGKLLFGDGLELAGIGTIADQLPLIGANRSFAKYGLERLKKTVRPGLLAMYRNARINSDAISSYTIGFIIAPRLNAMGRLEHAIESLRLLCTKSPQSAERLAQYLEETNVERQKTVEKVLGHVRKVMEKESLGKAIIIGDESYHEGVIGLAAAKLVEEYYLPSIVLSLGKRKSKASARSIEGFNIIEAINSFSELLINAGGHPMAAGFSIKTGLVEEFTKRFKDKAGKILGKKELSPTLKIDLEMEFGDINYPLVKKIEEFEPFGNGNPNPSFLTKKVEIVNARAVGAKRDHLKLKFRKNNKVFNAIGFGMVDLVKDMDIKGKFDIVYSLELNRWNNDINIELKLKDIKPSL